MNDNGFNNTDRLFLGFFLGMIVVLLAAIFFKL